MTSRYLTLTSLSLLILSACASTPVNDVAYMPLPQLTYEHLSKTPVHVKEIKFNSLTQRGAGVWDVANTLPTPPDVAMSRYLEQRFKPIGADGLLNMTLAKANIFKVSAPNDNQILSYLSIANVDEYTFEIIVEMESLYNSGLPDRKTSTRFVRKVRMPVNATAAYREAKFQRTLEEIIKDMDNKITSIFVDQFEIVKKRNRPDESITVKTEIPSIETELQLKLNQINDELRQAGQRDSGYYVQPTPDLNKIESMSLGRGSQKNIKPAKTVE